jgi:hypothetical protein
MVIHHGFKHAENEGCVVGEVWLTLSGVIQCKDYGVSLENVVKLIISFSLVA